MRISQSLRFFLAATVTILYIGGTGFGVITYADSIKTLRGELTAMAAKTALFNRKQESVHDLADILRAHARNIDRINASFVDPKEPQGFGEALRTIAELTHNKITLILDETPNSRGELVFHVTGEGSAKTLWDMIHLIDLMPYHISVERIDFSQDKPTYAASGLSPAHLKSRIVITIAIKTSPVSVPMDGRSATEQVIFSADIDEAIKALDERDQKFEAAREQIAR